MPAQAPAMSGADLRLHPRYSEGLRYLLAQSPDTQAWVPEVEEDDWEALKEKNQIKAFRAFAKSPSKLNRTKGIGVIEAEAGFVAHVVSLDYGQWDEHIKDLRILRADKDEASGATAEVIWSRYNLGVPGIKDRDFVYCEVMQPLPGGGWCIYGESLPEEEAGKEPGLPPCDTKVVRGSMGPGCGWVIAPTNDGRHCRVTYVSLTDLKGTFPVFLQNRFSDEVPQTIHSVRKAAIKKLSRQRQEAAAAAASPAPAPC